MNGVSRDAGKTGDRDAIASVRAFVEGTQAREARRTGKVLAGATIGGVLSWAAFGGVKKK